MYTRALCILAIQVGRARHRYKASVGSDESVVVLSSRQSKSSRLSFHKLTCSQYVTAVATVRFAVFVYL